MTRFSFRAFRPENRSNREACSLRQAAACAVAGFLASAQAQVPGDLDPTFGTGGLVQFDYNTTGSGINAIAIDPATGKIIAGGPVNGNSDGVVMRLNFNGSLDTTFATSGFQIINTGTSNFVTDIAVRQDGRIIAVGGGGTIDTPLPVVRLNANGSLDDSFAGDGIAELDVGGFAIGTAVALQTDNKIVVTFRDTGISGGFEFAVARVTSAGALDATFNAAGVVPGVANFDPTGNMDQVNDVAVQTDGRIVLVGEINNSGFPSNTNFGVVRFNANGTVNTGFGTGGLAQIDFDGGADTAYAVVIQPDGKILVAGSAERAGQSRTDMAVVRLNTNGTPDTTFDGDGELRVPFSGAAVAYDILLQTDGRFVLAGSQQESIVPNFAMARQNADGTPDLSFIGMSHPSYPATQIINFTGDGTVDRSDRAYSVARQADGRYVLAGETAYMDVNFALARLLDRPTPAALAAQFTLVSGLQGATHVARLRDDGFGDIRAEQRNTAAGTLVGNDAFFTTGDFTAQQIIGLPNIGGSASGDLAVLATRDTDGQIRAEIRDGDTGASIRQMTLLSGDYVPVWLFEVPDLDNNGKADLGLLALRASDNRALVKFAGSVSGAAIGAAVYYTPGVLPLQAEALPDLDASGAPDIAVLAAVPATGRYRVEIRNAAGAAARRTYTFTNGFDPVDFRLGPDTDGNSVPELAVLAQRRSDGRIRVEMRNAFGPAAVHQVTYSPGYAPVGLDLASDSDGNSVPEWAVLLDRNSDHRPYTQIRNATGPSGVVSRAYFTTAYAARRLFVLPDSDSIGGPDIGVIAQRNSDGRLRMEIRNAQGGGTTRAFFFSP
jgi:uncharacterized delta-60 repeat protein